MMLGLSPLSLLAGPSRSHHILHQVRPRTLQRSLKPLRSRHFSSTSTPFQQLGKITPKRLEIPLGPDSGIVSDRSLPIVSIWRPIIFCILLGGGGYATAAVYTNIDTDNWVRRLGGGSWWRGNGGVRVTDSEIQRAKKLDEAKEAQDTINAMGRGLRFLPQGISTFLLRSWAMFAGWELNTPPARLVPMELIAGMGVIALAWRSPRLEPFMRKWFLHRPVVFSSRALRQWQASVTLFTSTLSHQTLAHIAFNSIALYSFGGAAYSFLAAPAPGTAPMLSSTYTPHFLAFLLAGGLFSSLGSHLFTNLVRLPRLLRALRNPGRISSPQALAVQHGIMPGLGASGAIYAAVTLTALAYPQSGVSLIFLPFFSIPIGMGVSGLVLLDIIGLIRGWRAFDHVAHLTGAIFGVIYYGYGRQAWGWVRRQLRVEEQTEVA